MLKKFIMLFFIVLFSFGCSGCVSEAVNKSIGKMLNDPNALETPENPDDPIFDPESDKLIEHSHDDDINDRFHNR